MDGRNRGSSSVQRWFIYQTSFPSSGWKSLLCPEFFRLQYEFAINISPLITKLKITGMLLNSNRKQQTLNLPCFLTWGRVGDETEIKPVLPKQKTLTRIHDLFLACRCCNLRVCQRRAQVEKIETEKQASKTNLYRKLNANWFTVVVLYVNVWLPLFNVIFCPSPVALSNVYSRGGVLPYISYVGMYRPKGYGFLPVLV